MISEMFFYANVEELGLETRVRLRGSDVCLLHNSSSHAVYHAVKATAHFHGSKRLAVNEWLSNKPRRQANRLILIGPTDGCGCK